MDDKVQKKIDIFCKYVIKELTAFQFGSTSISHKQLCAILGVKEISLGDLNLMGEKLFRDKHFLINMPGEIFICRLDRTYLTDEQVCSAAAAMEAYEEALSQGLADELHALGFDGSEDPLLTLPEIAEIKQEGFFVKKTPSDYELRALDGRPTGLSISSLGDGYEVVQAEQHLTLAEAIKKAIGIKKRQE